MKWLSISLIILCIFGILLFFVRKEKNDSLVLEYNFDNCIANSDTKSNYTLCCGKDKNLDNCADKDISIGDVVSLSVNITDDYEKNMLKYPVECHYTNIKPDKEFSDKKIVIDNKNFYVSCENPYNFFNNSKQLYTLFIGKVEKSPFLFRILLAPEGVDENNLVENMDSCIEIFFIER